MPNSASTYFNSFSKAAQDQIKVVIAAGVCCLCGDRDEVLYCKICGHNFCGDCRDYWWKCGFEAIRTMLGKTKTLCGMNRHA